MAKELFLSESTYSRKENGLLKFERHEIIKTAKILELSERLLLRYWMADRLYELMKNDKDLVYESIKIVEAHYNDYENCVVVPDKNKSYSSLEERKIRRRQKKNV